MPDAFDQLPQQQPVTEPSYVAPPNIAPVKSPFGPLVFGFFLVIFVAGAIAVAYYMSRFQASPTASPSPSVVASPPPSPSNEASATPSASPAVGKTPTTPSIKPVSAIKMTASPIPGQSSFSLPSLDIRFGNPSANVKQTIDEGNGDGRVINREYTSIQVGQFDEVKASYAPKVTVCFHIIANEPVEGKDIKLSFVLNSNSPIEDTLSQYNKLEAGRLYDYCREVSTEIGKHTAKLSFNSDKSIKESNYSNNLGTVTYENLADNVAPNFTLVGPTNDAGKTCLTATHVSDNVTSISNLKLERKIGTGAWETTTDPTYCFSGTSGAQQTYSFRVTDQRNNKTEQTKTFNLF